MVNLSEINKEISNKVLSCGSTQQKGFEKAYTDVRAKEKRLLSDTQVLLLPSYPTDEPHAKEWLIRKKSSQNLLRYIDTTPLKDDEWIFDIGCGNGWFSNLLASNTNARIFGIDINQLELEQAAHLFKRENLIFGYWNLLLNPQLKGKAKIIIFNSSIQYFDNFEDIVKLCLSYLSQNGEIHILDSPFYKENLSSQAKERTEQYYLSIEAEDMIEYYHHHSYEKLSQFSHELMYKPLASDLRKQDESPFPWIKITK